MKKIRKINKIKHKQIRKDAEEQMAKQAALMMKHPTECCVCQAPFVRTQETVKTWRIVVREERVRLACSECWATVEKQVENLDAT